MKNEIKKWFEKAKAFVKNNKKIIKNVGLVGLVVGGLAIANKAKAPPFLDQFVYPHNGISPDSGIATVYKPDGTDSITAKIGEFLTNYWGAECPSSWNVQLNDSGLVKVQDTANQSSWLKWFANDGILPPGFPGGFGISVRDVMENSADSADAKCYKKGGNDTLYGRFRSNPDSCYYDLYFDGSLLDLGNGDSVIIEARAPGRSGFTQGIIQHRFIDADTLPCFSLTTLDLALNEILLPDSAKQDSTIIPGLTVQNYSVLKERPKFYFEIGSFYKDSVEKVLNANSIDTIIFQPCHLGVSPGNYLTKAYLTYKYDINQANDTLRGSIYVEPNVGIEDVVKHLRESTKGYLYDIVGRKVKEVEGKTSVEGLSPGVYFFSHNKAPSKPEKLIIFK